MRTLPRNLPQWDPHPLAQDDSVARNSIDLRLELVTPLFGGGAKPREPDSDNPFRASGIRGQLRFWWRALSPEADPQELKTAEDALWGNMNQRSQVAIAVNPEKNLPPAVPCCTMDGKGTLEWGGLPGYFLFPGQPTRPEAGKRGQPAAKIVMKGGAEKRHPGFRLHVDYPTEKEDVVLDTLAAWLVFGGIGGRTRRGCGTLRVVECPPEMKPGGLLKRLLPFLKNPRSTGLNGLPKLAGTQVFLTNKAFLSGEEAWMDLAKVYRRFRQSRLNPDSKVPGVSLWPEAGAIRGLTDSSYKQEKIPPKSPKSIFPRGGLGLPIIFHFKNDRPNCAKGHRQADPGDHTLIPEGHERWASPLILKPFWDGTAFHGLIVVLANSRPPDSLFLQGPSGDPIPVRTGLHEPQLAKDISPLKGKSDVLEAFLSAVKFDFEEVGDS